MIQNFRTHIQKERHILLLTHRFSLPKLAFEPTKNDQTFCPKKLRPPFIIIQSNKQRTRDQQVIVNLLTTTPQNTDILKVSV